jgi:hypothetical protein
MRSNLSHARGRRTRAAATRAHEPRRIALASALNIYAAIGLTPRKTSRAGARHAVCTLGTNFQNLEVISKSQQRETAARRTCGSELRRAARHACGKRRTAPANSDPRRAIRHAPSRRASLPSARAATARSIPSSDRVAALCGLATRLVFCVRLTRTAQRTMAIACGRQRVSTMLTPFSLDPVLACA